MNVPHSDALVFFGATGDLAYKKIFPALQALIRRGALDMPIIGVARSGWMPEQLAERARDSLENNGGVDADAFAKLVTQLSYIDGDYNDPATYTRLPSRAKRSSTSAACAATMAASPSPRAVRRSNQFQQRSALAKRFCRGSSTTKPRSSAKRAMRVPAAKASGSWRQPWIHTTSGARSRNSCGSRRSSNLLALSPVE